MNDIEDKAKNASMHKLLGIVKPYEWDLKYLFVQVFHNNGEYIYHIWIRKIDKPLFALGFPLIKTFGLNKVSFVPVAYPPSIAYNPEAFVIYVSDTTPMEHVVMQLRKIERLFDKPTSEIRSTLAQDMLKWNQMQEEKNAL